MSSLSLVTRGMLCTGTTTIVSGGGGGYHERDIQLEKPKINVIKVKTSDSKSGLNESDDISIKITKVITSN